MPSLTQDSRFRGISLPPSGWVLAILLATYIFTGLIGHDPWKYDDAVTIGVSYDVFKNGHWLTPQLAGQAYPDAPLYYWLAALMAQLFSWLLPVHGAMRLTSGLATLLTLEFILLAARELHGRDQAATAPLMLAGSIGFLFHAHEAQPMLLALAAHTAAYWALILCPRRPYFSASVLGSALATSFLADGLLPLLALLPVTVLAVFLTRERKKMFAPLAVALILALAIVALWLVPLQLSAPDFFAAFWANEWNTLAEPVAMLSNTWHYLNLLLWYAWPALPLAAWTLWAKRRTLSSKAFALPMLSFVLLLVFLGFCVETRSSAALILLPPLVLLAVPGISTLRRGAANAFDWFGMMTFTIFAAVAWLGWYASVFGWPTRLAARAAHLEPGFVATFNPLALLISLLATGVWFWLIATSPRSPMRGLMHWMAGLTLFWLLVAKLWMPWIDYGKTYRPLSVSLSASLAAQPKSVDCLANANLNDAVLASLYYFDDLQTLPAKSAAAGRCSWLLVRGEANELAALNAVGWHSVWEGKRPGDRRESEKIHLYRRGSKSLPATKLPDWPDDEAPK